MKNTVKQAEDKIMLEKITSIGEMRWMMPEANTTNLKYNFFYK